MMPEVDGFEFMRRVRGLPGAAEAVIIVVTAKDLGPEERIMLGEQVERIVQKDAIGMTELAEEVRSVAMKNLPALSNP